MTSRVIIVGQTPPPVGGQATMIKRLVEADLPGVATWHVELGAARSADDRGVVRFGKLLHLMRVIAQTLWLRTRTRADILYYPPSSQFAATVRDALVLASTRWAFRTTIFHFHAGGLSETLSQWPRPLHPLARCAFSRPDVAIQLSSLAPPDATAVGAKSCVLIPNGLPDRPPAPEITDRPLPARILFSGILCESKGVLILLDALALLRDRGVDFHATLAGPWESAAFERRARALVTAHALEHRVSFPGALGGDMYLSLFDEARVFCLPTFFESEAFPLVILEAMRAGVPVVATRWRGIPDLVEDGKTGLIVAPRNASAVAKAVGDLLEQPARAAAMGAAGRAAFEREYGIETFLARIREVLAHA